MPNGKGENVAEQNVNGATWKVERYFSSFEEADQLRRSLKGKDKTGIMEFKVKRCGESGTMFVVKSRESEALKAELLEIEEKMLTKKNKKK